MSQSAIEWTDATWNPTTGCTKVSAGCKHCYAERMSRRLRSMGVAEYAGGFKFATHPHKLTLPDKWRKARHVFVNSMSDLFHAACPDEFIIEAFAVMARNPRHTFQVLTKRPLRMKRMFNDGQIPICPNVWIGTSVESNRVRDRVDILNETGHEVQTRFLSCEPLLGPLSLGLSCYDSRIDWVIVGGESGPGARPMKPEWARAIRDECAAAGVAFFFKQWGGARKGKAGRLLDGVEHNAMPARKSRHIMQSFADEADDYEAEQKASAFAEAIRQKSVVK